MATATIKCTLPGLINFTGLQINLYEHPGVPQEEIIATAPLTVDTEDASTYWTTIDATTLSGIYRANIKEGDVERGAGYIKMTNTTAVHVVVSSPNIVNVDGTTPDPVTAEELSEILTPQIIAAVEEAIANLNITVKPETKILGPCKKPVVPVPKVVK
jgi:hypothetical protein